MALHLKLSTILVSMLVLSALAPIEPTKAANPFSLRRMKDFLKSVIQLATSQHHSQGPNGHHHPPEHHHQHRVMPTTITTPLSKDLLQLSREELEDLLEAELQEVHSRNDTNETLDNDLASNHTEDYDFENATEGYNATESPEEGTKPEEKSKSEEPDEKSKEGSKSTSKSHPSKVREEAVLGFKGRPCNHYFYGKWRKYNEYGRRGYATTEEPELSPVTEMEGTTTEPTIPENEESEIEPATTESSMEPIEIEPATTEPSIEPIETEPATTEPSIIEPTVTSEPVKRKSYMYVQEDRLEYHTIEVDTPNKGTRVVYIPVKPNGTVSIHCILVHIDNDDLNCVHYSPLI